MSRLIADYSGLVEADQIAPAARGFKPFMSRARAVSCPACPAVFVVELRFTFDEMCCSGCGTLVSLLRAWDLAPRVATLIRPDRKPIVPRYPSSAENACPGAPPPALRPAPIEVAMVPLEKGTKL